jgi:hypothetical protein
MSVGLREFEIGSARIAPEMETSARLHSARASSEVADVANRPKKRLGSRERSSITTRRRTMLV